MNDRRQFYLHLAARARELAEDEPDPEVRGSLVLFADAWRDLASGAASPAPASADPGVAEKAAAPFR